MAQRIPMNIVEEIALAVNMDQWFEELSDEYHQDLIAEAEAERRYDDLHAWHEENEAAGLPPF